MGIYTNTPKVSVIVPMYNCAAFLPNFFLDMQAQSLHDFELICVIDGATDNTLDIVKQYADKDERIRYFYKENGGAGTARNYGFEYARGEYVMWIDADDRYSSDLLKEMVSAGDKFLADEVLCLFDSYDYATMQKIEVRGFDKKFFPENTCVNPTKALIENTFSIAGSGPTNKLYRKTFINDNNLRYSATRVANDTKFIWAAISIAKKVVGIHKKLIHVQRCINPDSVTSNRGRYIQDVPIVFSELYQWLKERNLAERLHNTFCKSYKSGVDYNSQFGVNMEFVETVVKALNEEEPWINMDLNDIANLFGSLFDFAWMKRKIEILENEMQNDKEKRKKGLLNRIAMEQNRKETMSLIYTLSVNRYNREFKSWRYKIRSLIIWFPREIKYFIKLKSE